MSGRRESDHQLVERCLAGEDAAWEELVRKYAAFVFSIARGYRLSASDADDVLQAVWSIAFKNLHTLRDHERLAMWLATTTHRECWRIGRRSKSFASEDIARHFDDVSSPPEDQSARWEQQHLVRVALEELGGRCQRLLTALFLAGDRPRYERIAEELDMPISSIGPTRSRCFRKLERLTHLKHLFHDVNIKNICVAK